MPTYFNEDSELTQIKSTSYEDLDSDFTSTELNSICKDGSFNSKIYNKRYYKKFKLGVLGGLGPIATIFFMNMLYDKTAVKRDQDNIDMVVMQHSSIPDRTAYITGKSLDSPYEYLLRDALDLCDLGCTHICMTCNTSHYFYKSLVKNIDIPFINMVEETMLECRKRKFKKIGVMATKGTIYAELYRDKSDMSEYFYPNDVIQKDITSLIYDFVKAGKISGLDKFNSIIDYFKDKGCDGIILGCTELSIIASKYNMDLDGYLVDSMNVLGNKIISLFT